MPVCMNVWEEAGECCDRGGRERGLEGLERGKARRWRVAKVPVSVWVRQWQVVLGTGR